MSSSIISSLTISSQELTIYIGISILIFGIIGEILNVLVFLSLQTFRHNSCAFYLIIMSCVNLVQLLSGLLSRIVIGGYTIDWTLMSLFFCKFRWFSIQTCTLTSYACLCLATIDQYLATCTLQRWQQWSNIQLARRLSLLAFILVILHGIPCFIFYNHSVSPTTGEVTCSITNSIYLAYNTYPYLLVLSGILPISITVLFGSLAYRNVQQLAYRTVPLVRRELDKQLTTMVLIQAFYSSVVISIYFTWSIIMANLHFDDQPLIAAQLQVVTDLVIVLYYFYSAVSINRFFI
jgi:hypothetical protein